MKLVYGDLWEYQIDHPNRWVVITTNGSVKSNGENIMGSGCAKELKTRYPEWPKKLGNLLKFFGNHCYADAETFIISFPTKHQWFNDSDLDLIKQSAEELAEVANAMPDDLFVLPRPGVGAGKLNWEDVLPEIQPILPDNVHCITWG